MPPTFTYTRVTGQDVADFLNRPDLAATADQHAVVVTAMARSYTRGRGFDEATGDAHPDVAAVILMAAARLAVNPAQLDQEQADGYAARGAFKGWTLAELSVLHAWRKRAA